MTLKLISGCLAWIAILLSGGMAADAAVVVTYRGNAPNPLPLNGVAYTQFDIDGDGVADFAFNNGSGILATLHSEGENRFVGIPPGIIESGGHTWHVDPQVIPLETGTLIGPGAVFPLDGEWYGDISLLGYASSGMMQLSNGYIGVEFRIDDKIHYGWIHYVGFSVGFEHGMPPELPRSVDWPGGWINSWAYNSIPGEPIYAGQIPEPSLALLAGIAALVAAVSRKRRTALDGEASSDPR